MKRTFTLFFFYETIKYDLILKSSENQKKSCRAHHDGSDALKYYYFKSKYNLMIVYLFFIFFLEKNSKTIC